MTISKTFFYFCLSFIIGIFLNSFFNISQVFQLGFLILGIMFISIFWGRWQIVIIGFCFLIVVLGAWHHEKAEMKIINSQLQNYNDLKEAVSFTGIVLKEPDIRDSHIKLTIGDIYFTDNQSEKARGRVLITIDRYSEYQYGDEIKIKGKLERPEIFDEFNYQDYLKKDGIYSVMYYPETEILEREKYTGATRVYAGVLRLKDGLRRVVYQNISPPQSSFLAAIILGDKGRISQEWKDKLNYAGARHLTAISGMHVAILTVILMSFLTSLGLWRRQAFYLTITFISFFIILTGFQPSAIRAGIMAGFFLLAQHLGRINVSARAIVLAAALMLFFNPLLLKLDIGFQLSFLAMLGIIYFSPVLQVFLDNFVRFLQKKKNFSFSFSDVQGLKNIFIMTVSAQVFVLPILIYNFGYFSIVSLLTNILIVPFLPFIMALGFIFVLIGNVSSFFAWVLSLPLWLVLSYLIKVVDSFSGFSFSVLFFKVSWFWFLIYYFFLIVFIWRFNEKQKINF